MMQIVIDRKKSELFDNLLGAVNDQFSENADTNYSQYASDPCGFAEEILGETLTPDIKRMMESVRDHPVTVCVTGNGVGKTHGAARVALWWLICFAESQCYTAAAPPESNLRRLLWGEIGSVVEKNNELFQDFDVKTLHVGKTANSFLTGVAIPATGTAAQREARFSGKHAPHLLFVLDEGDAIDDAVYKGIESCLSGGHGRLLVMFNPRAEQGAPYRMIRDRVANVVKLSAFTHPNVLTGENQIPGAVDQATTVRRINQWTRPLNSNEQPDNTCFELPKFLVGKVATDQAGRPFPPLGSGHYKVTEPSFSYMVLGKYPSQGSTQLISREWLDNARSRWDAHVAEHGETPPSSTSAVMGLDVGEFGTDANVACFRYGGYVERLIPWSGVDTFVTGNRAADEYKARNVRFCNVDATGVGAGVAPHMMTQGSMKQDNVTDARQMKDSSIELTIRDPFNGAAMVKRYAAIRGGLSWPTATGAAYFCIVGQEFVEPKRVMLAEYESDSLSMTSFYGHICDIAEQMMCKEFYTDLPEKEQDCGFTSDFEKFAKKRNSKVSVQDAYDADNFILGISRIKGSIDTGELIVPDDSLVYSQLQGITQSDLENAPEAVFNAINGLRHVLASFCRYAPINKEYTMDMVLFSVAFSLFGMVVILKSYIPLCLLAACIVFRRHVSMHARKKLLLKM